MAQKKMHALWWWIDRWRKSTAYTDMTLEQQGAYRNLLDEATLRGGPLPNDERVLAKACGDQKAWKRLRPVLMPRFVLTADGLRNETLDEVLRESERRAEKQRRWRLNRGNATGNSAGNNAGNTRGSPDPDPISGSHKEHKNTIARPSRAQTPIIGRNPHLTHVLCDETHAYCVPAAVHQKLATLLAPKYSGDYDKAAEALLEWYPTIWAKLVAGFVMGEAFKFWQGRFDAAFASAAPAPAAKMFKEPTLEDVEIQREMLRKKDAQRERDRAS